MNRKPYTSSNLRLFSILLLLGSLLPNWGGNNVSSLGIQSPTGDHFASAFTDKVAALEEFTINTGNYEIPQELLTVLQTKLGEITEASGGATVFGVGYYEEHPHLSVGSIEALAEPL